MLFTALRTFVVAPSVDKALTVKMTPPIVRGNVGSLQFKSNGRGVSLPPTPPTDISCISNGPNAVSADRKKRKKPNVRLKL